MKRHWRIVDIETREGVVQGQEPLIVSASRATDIPAFYADWLMFRFHEGYVKRYNPFNGRASFVSLAGVRAIVFWSKNPLPVIPYLPWFLQRDITFYFQFTLNDYQREHLEPGVPPLADRIETFITIAKRFGRERVVWRFDPILLSDTLDCDDVLERIQRIGDAVAPFTEKLVFSFIDIVKYRKVQRALSRLAVGCREPDEEERWRIAEGIARLAAGWGIEAAACAEPEDFSRLNIRRNRCIDPALLARLSPHRELLEFLGFSHGLFPDATRFRRLKDPGQRKHCRCIASKDLGRYDTCLHLCRYCYANGSPARVRKNYANYRPDAEALGDEV